MLRFFFVCKSVIAFVEFGLAIECINTMVSLYFLIMTFPNVILTAFSKAKDKRVFLIKKKTNYFASSERLL